MYTLLDDIKQALAELEAAKKINIYNTVPPDAAEYAHVGRMGGLDEAIYRLKHIIKNHEKSSDV